MSPNALLSALTERHTETLLKRLTHGISIVPGTGRWQILNVDARTAAVALDLSLQHQGVLGTVDGLPGIVTHLVESAGRGIEVPGIVHHRPLVRVAVRVEVRIGAESELGTHPSIGRIHIKRRCHAEAPMPAACRYFLAAAGCLSILFDSRLLPGVVIDWFPGHRIVDTGQAAPLRVEMVLCGTARCQGHSSTQAHPTQNSPGSLHRSSPWFIHDHSAASPVAFLAGLCAAVVLLSRLLMAMGGIHDYLSHPVRQDSDPVCLHLERRSRLAALLPAVLNHLAHYHNPHAPLVQSGPALGITVPPLHIGPEATTIHDLSILGDQVIESHV